MKFSDLKKGMILTKVRPDDTASYRNVKEVKVVSLNDPYLDVKILSRTDSRTHSIGETVSMRASLENFEIKIDADYEIF